MQKQDHQKLQEENEQLKAALKAYKDVEKERLERKGWFVRKLGSLGSWFFLGGDLKKSIKQLVNEVADKDKQVSKDTIGNVLAHGAWRFTRITLFMLLMAFIPSLILITQTTLLLYQNKKLDIQNILLEKQDSLFQNQNKLVVIQNNRLEQQTYLQEASRRSSLVFLFSDIMNSIDRELREDLGKKGKRDLSPQLIGRIIALSSRLKPYRYLDGDTLIKKELSPERGQLLVSLIESKLDDLTYNAIFWKANFNYADLARADLSNTELSKANLGKANLIFANLRGANLEGINLIEADLRGAKLNGARLRGARLKKADLRRSILKKADLRKVDFNGAKLNEANLSEANLSEAKLSNAKWTNAILYRANLSRTDLSGTDLSKTTLMEANLSKAILSFVEWDSTNLHGANLYKANLFSSTFKQADLREANLTAVNLSEANLVGTKIDSLNFMQKLNIWEVIGRETIQETYYVDTTPQYDSKQKKEPFYIIKKK